MIAPVHYGRDELTPVIKFSAIELFCLLYQFIARPHRRVTIRREKDSQNNENPTAPPVIASPEGAKQSKNEIASDFVLAMTLVIW